MKFYKMNLTNEKAMIKKFFLLQFFYNTNFQWIFKFFDPENY